MLMPSDWFAIEILFNLLWACRQGNIETARGLHRVFKRRQLALGKMDNAPRFSFWVRLARSADLLDEQMPPQPTLLACEWLSWSLGEQLQHLTAAWVGAAQRADLQALRRSLLLKLAQKATLGAQEKGERAALAALGFCVGDGLTPLGLALAAGDLAALPKHDPPPWRLVENNLQVAYPPDWALLWDLETYLLPETPGSYPLSDQALQRAAQRGAMLEGAAPALVSILAAGLGEPPPKEIETRLLAQAAIQVLPGPVLAFSDAESLRQLRVARSWRAELEDIISPRHVHLDPWRAPVLLRRLRQRGLLHEHSLEAALRTFAPAELPEKTGKRDKGSFSKADRAYLLSLLLIAEGLDLPLAAPLGLAEKLIYQMGEPLRASAARKARKAIEARSSRPAWLPEPEPPDPPEQVVIAFIERAIHTQESIDFDYQAPNRNPEHRHVTPLLLEQRGLRYYLIAYCHKRRANRTFRLDRLKLRQEPPLE